MAFEPDKWADGEEGNTPITAAELNRIESAGAAKAAKGDKGDKGNKGDEGPAGFGTEAQYNAIISRLDALEADTTA